MEMSEFNNANQTISQMNIDPAHLYRNHQLQQQQAGGLRYLPQNQANFNQQQHQNKSAKQHRELPVDVPESFVGVAKQSPRYPPPKPHRQVLPISNPYVENNTNGTNNIATTNTNKPVTQQQATSINNSRQQQQTANNVIHNPTNQQQQSHHLHQSTATNLMNHNSSLRSSIKLKQLEKSRNGGYPVGHMQAAVNQAFELNEDDAVPQKNHQQQQTNKQLNNLKQPDLCSIYNRLQRNLVGEFADISGDAKLAKLLLIYNTIVQTHNKQYEIPSLISRHAQQDPIVFKAADLLQSVITLLHDDDEMTNDAAELSSILCKHEMYGVCSAFDRIAQSFEYAKSSAALISGPASPFQQQLHHQPTSLDSGSKKQPNPSDPAMHDQNNMHLQANRHNNQMQMHHQTGYGLNSYDYTAENQIQMDIENNLYQNSLHPLTDIDLSDGTCTKTVRIEKTSDQALGATIKNEDDGSVVIGRIVCGGAAHSSGLLHEGDEILEVNGVQMRGKNINEVVNILEDMDGTLTFTVISRNNNNYSKLLNHQHPQMNLQEKIFVRAFFDYNGDNDHLIPCKELGLSFEKGDILTIIDQSDQLWWQAHKERECEWRLAGLIPSINFLKQREKDLTQLDLVPTYNSNTHNVNFQYQHYQCPNQYHQNQHHNQYYHSKYEKTKHSHFVSRLFNCPKSGQSGSSSPKRRRKPLHNHNNGFNHNHGSNNPLPYGPDEIPYYEEVYLYYPIKYIKRPIILVGPKMIGQREIVKKLLQDSNRFESAISHTSKPKQDHERDGIDFHFVTRAQFEADIKAGKFIECGLYQNHHYGTSFDAMKEVVSKKKTCVHIVNTPSIFNFRQGRAGSELKPFFVFVKPDDSHPEKLRNIVTQFSQPKTSIEENIKSIMAEVQIIEQHYLPYFDLVLTVSDVDRAYQELLFEIEKIETEPQWIPSFWQQTPPN